MTEAINWSLTQEGVSDLRRFWNGRPTDFNIDELVAFFNTLPDESSTKKAVNKHKASLDIMVSALVVDSVRELHMGFANKRMSDKDRLFNLLSEKDIENKEDLDDFMKRAKKKLND